MLFSRYPVIAPVALSIALLITSCSDSKTSQCQRLIKAVNHGTLLKPDLSKSLIILVKP